MTSTRPEKTQASGYWSLIYRNKEFRWLWFGQIISLFGDWFNLIASAALVSQLTRSGLAIGGLFVVRMLAPFLVSPLAGVAADRYNRKQLMIAADLLRAAVVLGFLLVRDPRQVWLLYSLTAVQLAISGFFYPARNAILPDIVIRQELGAANALSSATWSVMLAFGSALGGLVAGQWGIYPAFVIDAITFLISALCITQIAYQPVARMAETGHAVVVALRQYVEGLRYLSSHLDVLVLALQKGAFALVIGGGIQVVQVALADVFKIGQAGGTSLGILYAVTGVGTGLGPIVARRFTGDRERPLHISMGLAYAISILGLAISAPMINFGWVLLGSLLRSIGGGINWMFSTQLLLQALPDRVRGRVFSTEFALFTLANALGAGLGGYMLDQAAVDLSGMMWGMAGLTLLPGVLWVAWLFLHPEKQPSLPPAR